MPLNVLAKGVFVLSLSIASILLPAWRLQADVVSLQADRDNTLYQTELAAQKSNGLGPRMFAGRTAESVPNTSIRRALVRFDVAASIPAGAVINSGTLRLFMSKTNTDTPASVTVSLHRTLADWGEGTSNAGTNGGFGATPTEGSVTWYHRFWSFSAPNSIPWAVQGGQFTAVASVAISVARTTTFYTWGSTPGMVTDVQFWLDNPASNFGWVIRGDETQQPTARRFDTRNATASNRPVLTVNYTPAAVCSEPADGDMNEDNLVDGDDIQVFVSAILGTPTPAQKCHGDFSGDMLFNSADVDGFVAVLSQ